MTHKRGRYTHEFWWMTMLRHPRCTVMPVLAEGVGWIISRAPFRPSPACDSVICCCPASKLALGKPASNSIYQLATTLTSQQPLYKFPGDKAPLSLPCHYSRLLCTAPSCLHAVLCHGLLLHLPHSAPVSSCQSWQALLLPIIQKDTRHNKSS